MVYTFFSVDPWILSARLNEYHGALRAGAIVKVGGFEVGRCTNMYKRTDSPFIFQPNPKVFGGNLYLNSTPATKFYLDTNILAIEAFTNRLSHVHVSIAGLHTYIATSNNQNGWSYVSCTGCSRELDKSWTALYRNKCVSPKIAGVLRLMAVEGMSFQAALRILMGSSTFSKFG
ncbi:PREDICTED: uncharacterized protein LOC106316498 isoform X3 [Brassica oleracea var. oleracea]|uniref:Uncharacterized protein n=1 Tax=Brassica oleracea var. oleracea TaxID=109376 RepID=A0A0D3E3E4_BRAOL|nr:PREDICTED: uncharacterized protein LOC106316498 isoform X3 [Brassica oleracea var. oleracea]